MKNTIAIGIPDKVGRAERDNEEVNKAFAKMKFPKDNFGSIKNFTRSTVHKKKEKVIEFDLPKGYSAEDAFESHTPEYGKSLDTKCGVLTKRQGLTSTSSSQ